MKALTFFLPLLFPALLCSGQDKGIITTRDLIPKANKENIYFYYPPKNLVIPKKLEALVVYVNNNDFFYKAISLGRVENYYSFKFKVPDSTAVLIFSLVDAKKTVLQNSNFMKEKNRVVDNNNGTGFIVYLHDKKARRFDFANISLASLLTSYAIHRLDLKPLSGNSIIKMYENTYTLYPALKKQDSYIRYLNSLYSVKFDTIKPMLLRYAAQLMLIKTDERKLINAESIFELLKMDVDQKNTERQILTIYPNGQFAESVFWDSLWNKPRDEQFYIASMKEYISRFKDSSFKIRDRFYSVGIISYLLANKEFDKLSKYENLIHNKLSGLSLYNYYAWKFSGKKLDNVGNDLDIAKVLSRKSIEYLELIIKSDPDPDEYDEDLEAVHDMYVNTYALILYKLKQYDSAFYYQDLIYKHGKELLDAAGYERYAAYSEKAKGLIYTKQLIEEQLLRGINSTAMQIQLQSIYKQLHIPEDEFVKLKKTNQNLAKQRALEKIREKFGTIKATEFSLKNLLGQNVSLSSFKNKIVVLDFWATWCEPCKASFPEMKKTINNYKSDTEVVFLFIDVLENSPLRKLQVAVQKYMNENKYEFNVLFDQGKKVVNDYRIESIPKRMIIDTKGNFAFIGEDINYLDDISSAIEAAKN